MQRPVLLLLLLSLQGLNRAKRAVHGTYAQEQIVVQSHVQPETNNEIRVVQRAAQVCQQLLCSVCSGA